MIFLPMAYTRRLLSDVSFPDGILAPGGRVTLSAEPVFLAALGRAQRAGRGEIERIAVRGSEFDATNSALGAGSELSDLMVAEPALVTDLEPVKQGDGGAPCSRASFVGTA